MTMMERSVMKTCIVEADEGDNGGDHDGAGV